jgi:hypothetical protein
MVKDGQKHIDFKFAKNWKAFMQWYDNFTNKSKSTPPWEYQEFIIQKFFEASNPRIINWGQLWEDFVLWRTGIFKKKQTVAWSEQQRQIETLMLNQLKELNKEQYVLVFLNRGRPDIDTNVMTYWEAQRVKEQLQGDRNGNGGNEDMDRITVVNLKNLIQ